MVNPEIKYAQQEILHAANDYVSSARLRLAGTKFEKDVEELWKKMSSLNRRLVKEIRG